MSVPVSQLRIVARWADMYADWDEGKQVSPSAGDLINVAADLWGVSRSLFDAVHDAFYEYTQESTSLEEQVEFLAEWLDRKQFGHEPPRCNMKGCCR